MELVFLRLNKLIKLFNTEAMNNISVVNILDLIESINSFLESKYHEESYYIDIDVIKKLRSIHEIVTSNINGKNARYYKSIDFLDIKDNMLNRESSLRLIATFFKRNRRVYRGYGKKNTKTENELYSTLAVEKVTSRKKHNTKKLLDTYPEVIKYLKVMVKVASIIDTELAEQVSVEIHVLRKEMYPSLGHVFYYNHNYKSFDSTEIFIADELRDIVKKLIFDAV